MARKRERRHPAVEQWIQEQGRKGGLARAESLTPEARRRIARKGGKARAAKLTAAERSASALKAIKARWAKRKEP